MTLDKAKRNCKYCIKTINGERCQRLRMISLGIIPGQEIYCCNNQWQGIIINCFGCRLAMRKEEAALIEIAPMD